jgi:hypothetical protein
MLVQVSLFQSIAVYRCDNGSKQLPKVRGECFAFFIPGVVLHVVIEISEQMDQAFLLRTRQGVIGGIKIGDEDPSEILQEIV